MKNTHAKKLVVTLLSMCFLLSASAFAAGTTQKQKITKLTFMGNGSLSITGAKAWRNKEKCKSSAYAVLKSNNKHFNKIYAMLLVAHANNSRVTLGVSKCVKVSGKTRPVVVGVSMY